MRENEKKSLFFQILIKSTIRIKKYMMFLSKKYAIMQAKNLSCIFIPDITEYCVKLSERQRKGFQKILLFNISDS